MIQKTETKRYVNYIGIQVSIVRNALTISLEYDDIVSTKITLVTIILLSIHYCTDFVVQCDRNSLMSHTFSVRYSLVGNLFFRFCDGIGNSNSSGGDDGKL